MLARVTEMDQLRRVERALGFFGKEGAERDEAFAILHADGHKILGNYLARRHLRPDDAEEIVQSVFLKVFNNWHRLRFSSTSAWYGYLYEAARNTLRDKRQKPAEELASEPVDRRSDTFVIVERHLEAQHLQTLADSLWIGNGDSEGPLRCLAAKLLFIDKTHPDHVLRFLRAKGVKDCPADCTQIVSWLDDGYVLRKLAFDALYFSAEKLTALLLGISALSKDEMELVEDKARSSRQDALAIGTWQWCEVQFILLRYRSGMSVNQAHSRTEAWLSKERAFKIDAICAASFPFVSIMTRLRDGMKGLQCFDPAFAGNSLWKRLVFQYHVAQELAQEDILGRVSPPAEVVGYRLNNINTWIANRLAKELSNHAAKEKCRCPTM